MKTFHLAFVAIALISACGKESKKEAPKATERTAPAPAPAAAPVAPAAPAPPPTPAVKAFRDATYHFAVEHARDPDQGDQQVPTPLGTLTAHSYMFSAPSDPGAMMVMVTPAFIEDGKGVDLDKVLEDSQQGSMTTMNGTLVDSSKIELDGAIGRAFRFKVSPQGHAASGYAKVLIKNGTLYQVMTIGMENAKAFQTQGDAFVDSFHLLK